MFLHCGAQRAVSRRTVGLGSWLLPNDLEAEAFPYELPPAGCLPEGEHCTAHQYGRKGNGRGFEFSELKEYSSWLRCADPHNEMSYWPYCCVEVHRKILWLLTEGEKTLYLRFAYCSLISTEYDMLWFAAAGMLDFAEWYFWEKMVWGATQGFTYWVKAVFLVVGCFSLFLFKKKVLAWEGRLQRKGLSLKQGGI